METTTVPTETVTGSETPVRANGIEKTYGSRLPFGRSTPVLTGADIEVPAGEIVGIVGENGSGKSTLMQMLVGAVFNRLAGLWLMLIPR